MVVESLAPLTHVKHTPHTGWPDAVRPVGEAHHVPLRGDLGFEEGGSMPSLFLGVGLNNLCIHYSLVFSIARLTQQIIDNTDSSQRRKRAG